MTLKRKDRRAELLVQRLVEARHGEAVARGLLRHVSIDEVDVREIACVLERGDDDGLPIELEHISAAHGSHQEALSLRRGKADLVPGHDTHRLADGRRQGELTLARQCCVNRSPTRTNLLAHDILLTGPLSPYIA